MTRIEFTTACQDAPGILSSDFCQPRAVTHGRSASVPYLREDGGMKICDTQVDVPRLEGLGRNLRSKTRWFTGFCNSHQVSHFATFFIDARAEISIVESLLGMDERITTESAGTVRNQPTESDVSSFSGHSVSRWTSRNVADGKPPVTPLILDRIVGTAMVRGKRTSRPVIASNFLGLNGHSLIVSVKGCLHVAS
ncbi:hypothetical protein YC2023_108498 [Brassica napus]